MFLSNRIFEAKLTPYQQRKLENDVRSLRNSLSSLREQYADLEDAHSSLSRSTAQTIAAQGSQISTLTYQANLHGEELAELRAVAEQRSKTIASLQEQLDESTAAEDILVRKGAEEENMHVIREELHRQASYLRTLESTNTSLTAELAVLRERHASVEVLREEKRGLERKVQTLEQLREKVVRLEAEVEAGRREREAW